MTQPTFSPNGHKRAVLYARVSTEEQATDDSASIPQQCEEMRALCEHDEIIGEFIDSRDYRATQNPKRGKIVNPSGERADRPQFLAMLEVIKSGTADMVVCWRDDRLVRHPRVASALEDALDLGDKARGNKPKIQIVDATGAQIDRFVLHIKAVIGREDNKRRVERFKIGKIGTLKMGRWPGHYSRYGYSTVRELDKLGVEIVLTDDSEVQTVKDIFNWCDAGLALREIHDKLVMLGANQKGAHNKQHDWSTCTIGEILRADEYIGKATWNFEDGTSYTIDIPQIVTLEQFKRVQERLEKNKVLSTRHAKGVYLLQGVGYCGECNGALAVNQVRYHLGGVRKDGTRKRYDYETPKGFQYRCCKKQRYQYESHPSPATWNGEKLDWEVWRYVVDNGIKHPELIQERILTRQAELQAEGENVEGSIAHARAKLAEIEQERATYQRQNARGKMTDDEFDARIAETDEQKDHWQGELSRLVELRDNTNRVSVGLDYIANLMMGLQERLPKIDQGPEVLKAMALDKQQAILSQRQEIIRALCEKVLIWANGHVEIVGLLDGSEAAQFELDNTLIDLLKLTWTFEFDVIGGLFAKVPLPNESPAEVLQ